MGVVVVVVVVAFVDFADVDVCRLASACAGRRLGFCRGGSFDFQYSSVCAAVASSLLEPVDERVNLCINRDDDDDDAEDEDDEEDEDDLDDDESDVEPDMA